MSYTTYFYNEFHSLQGYINSRISLECANSIKYILHNNTYTRPGLYHLYNSTSNTISYTLYNNLINQKEPRIKKEQIPSTISCLELFKAHKSKNDSIQYLNVIRGEASCNIIINRENSNQIRCLCNSSISPVLLYTDPSYINLDQDNDCEDICNKAKITSPKLEIKSCKNTILTIDSDYSTQCVFSITDKSYQIKSGYIYSKSKDYWLDLCNTAYSLSGALNYCINDENCVGIFTTPSLDTSWVLSYASTLTKYNDARYISIRNIEHIISPMTYKSYKYEAGPSPPSPSSPIKNNDYNNILIGKKMPSYFKYISQYSTNIDISNVISPFNSNPPRQLIINKTSESNNYFIYFGMDTKNYIKAITNLYNNKWNTVLIWPIIFDHWADTKMGWEYNSNTNLSNSINDELRAYSLTWKFLEWLKHIFTYKNGIPQIEKLVIGGESNGAAFTSRLLEDHARWHYKKGSRAYISWLRYVEPANIAAVFTAGGSHHCYANPSGATHFNFPDSHYISGDKACGKCLNIATDTSMRNSTYEGKCYNTGATIPNNIHWNKSCYYCCPKYTQKTYMENSTLPYPPILTYQYNNGDCSAEKNNSSSICLGYTDVFNNNIGTDAKCLLGKRSTTTQQYDKSSNCLIDILADTCAGNKLFSVAKTTQKTKFNTKSKSIGINNYYYNNYSSHLAYPYITDNSKNYSIYQWLLDISFISELSCNACNTNSCAPNSNINILKNRTCISSNSINYNECCNASILDRSGDISNMSKYFSRTGIFEDLSTCSSWEKPWGSRGYCSRLEITDLKYTNNDISLIRQYCPSSCHLNICINDDNPNFMDKNNFTCDSWKTVVKNKTIQDGTTNSCSDLATWEKYSNNGAKPYNKNDLLSIIYNCPHACNICPDF